MMSDNIGESIEKANQYYDSKQYKEALSGYYELSCKGYSESQKILGWMYFKGLGTEVDFDKAQYWMEQVVANGEGESCYFLGQIFEEKNDPANAFKIYSKGKELDDLGSIYRLAKCYRLGKGIDRDVAKSRALINEACQKGHILSKKEISLQGLKNPLRLLSFLRSLGTIVRLPFIIFSIANKDMHDPRLTD